MNFFKIGDNYINLDKIKEIEFTSNHKSIVGSGREYEIDIWYFGDDEYEEHWLTKEEIQELKDKLESRQV